MAMHEVALRGCRPTPLAHYLKALAILRLVGDQVDSSCRGAWRHDDFVLWSTLDADALVRFLMEDYCPTPVIAPWNGGSGFHPKDNIKGIAAIESSTGPRFGAYRDAIASARATLAKQGLNNKPDKTEKAALLASLRGRLPDPALEWMDAALLLAGSADKAPTGVAYGVDAKYPPLLGTGGNDGRLEFTNNFMQRTTELLGSSAATSAASEALVRHSLFGSPVDQLHKGAAIGQFLPGDAGGANGQAGFDADSLINPWDFVLMIEGAVLFASAAVRRHEQDTLGAMSYPFTVHTVAAGYGSASAADEPDSRAEMWLPLWAAPTGIAELKSLLAEGRARVGGRSARNGVDFARAAVSLGVDRGITGFERIGFQVRNGLSYLATPLGRIAVVRDGALDPVGELEAHGWLDSFRRAASDRLAPARVRRALRGLETSVIDACRKPEDADRTFNLFVELGRCEAALAASLKWTLDKRVRPMPRLEAKRWRVSMAGASCPELRLALAAASAYAVFSTGGLRRRLGVQSQIEPVIDDNGRLSWIEHKDRDVAWQDAVPVIGLIKVLQRRLLVTRKAGVSHFSDQGVVTASLSDVAMFIHGETDDDLLAQLLWSSVLIDWRRATKATTLGGATSVDRLPPLYGLMKLCFSGEKVDNLRPGIPQGSDRFVPIVPGIIRHAEAKHADRACEMAVRRLRGCGLTPKIRNVGISSGESVQRIAASLMFPISRRDLQSIGKRLLVKDERAGLNSQQKEDA